MLQKSMSTQQMENMNQSRDKKSKPSEMSDSDYDENFKSSYDLQYQNLKKINQNLLKDRQKQEYTNGTESRRSRRKKKIIIEQSDSELSEEEMEQEKQIPDPQIFDPPIESIHKLRERGGKREFYVKFQNKSFRHCKWFPELDLLEYDPSIKNKLNRFLRDIGQNSYEQEQIFINYDPQFLEIDRILDCSVMFPIIHPKKGSQIKQKWTNSLLSAIVYLVNYEYEGIFYGIFFLDMSEQASKFELENNLDFSIIINRIYLDYYQEPWSFWQDILQVYQNFDLFNHQREGNDNDILLSRMKQITKIIFQQWKQQHFNDFDVIQNFISQNYKEEEILEFSKDFLEIFSMKKEQKSAQLLNQVQDYINKHKQFLPNKNKIEELMIQITQKGKILEEHKKMFENSNGEQEKVNSENNNSGDQEETNSNDKNSNDDIESNVIHNEKKALKELITELQILLNQNIEKVSSLLKKSKLKNLDIIYSQDLKRKIFLEEINNPDLSWIENEELQNSIDITKPYENKYLVKWKELSYLECTWEQFSFVKNFQNKLSDFKRFNRALIKDARLDYLERFNKNQELRDICSNPKRFNKQHPLYLYDLKKKIFGIKENNQIFKYSVENQPIYKEHRMLRDYQLESLNWMIEAWTSQRNVILADEMGLGKTIQAMSYLNHLVTLEKLAGPFLILAPLGTLQHWKRVFEDWSYMNSILYYDKFGKQGRAMCRQMEWYRNDVTKKGNMTQHFKIIKFQVIITSFEVFLQDFEQVFQEIPFQHIVIDEAHKLKNKKAKILIMLKKLVCSRILLLTGTPIQNNISELWSLLNFIEPSIFRDIETFKKEYDDLSNITQLEKLKRQLSPYMLRRMKEDVESSIPPLQETIIDIELTNIQKMVYKTVYEKSKGTLQKGLGLKFVSMMNNLEMQLRKCCNHPFLLQGIKENIIVDVQSHEAYFEKLLQSSGKMIFLDKLIQKFQKENKKILIFSQFTAMLKVIEEYLHIKKIHFEKIDGSTKAQNRQAAIDRFNKRKDKFEVFLLSTKAGGIGINLTSAKIVIIYDSDWNPQNDVQAIARAHRIGQTDKVKVFRLVSKKTYESEMFERASKKLGLDQAIFLTGNLQQNPNDIKQGEDMQKLKPEEIELLLKKGMLGLLQDDNTQNQEDQFNLDIDKVIENARVANYSFTKGSYTFAKGNFDTTSKENKVLLDDPDFWKKVFKGSDTPASKLQKKYDKKIQKGVFKLMEVQKEFLLELSDQIHKYLIERVKSDGFCAETERGFEELLQKLQDSTDLTPSMEEVVNQLGKDFEKKSRRVKKIDEKYMKNIIKKKSKRKRQQLNNEAVDKNTEDKNEIFQEERQSRRNKINSKNTFHTNCIICDKDKSDFQCEGDCQNQMHLTCLQNLHKELKHDLQKNYPQIDVSNYKFDKICFLCFNEMNKCLVCQKYQDINSEEPTAFQKCKQCNYFYHLKCLPEKLVLKTETDFLCPRHFCNDCEKKQENLYKCLYCPVSYHKKCMSKQNKILRKGVIRCSNHKQDTNNKKSQKQKQKLEGQELIDFYKEKNITPPSEFDYISSKDPWCRFCGARYSPQFYDSKLGIKTLCEFHYKRNLKQPLRLKEQQTPLKLESNTEKKYIQIIQIYDQFNLENQLIRFNLFQCKVVIYLLTYFYAICHQQYCENQNYIIDSPS